MLQVYFLQFSNTKLQGLCVGHICTDADGALKLHAALAETSCVENTKTGGIQQTAMT